MKMIALAGYARSDLEKLRNLDKAILAAILGGQGRSIDIKGALTDGQSLGR
jgi:hypothetical protein